MNAVDNLVTVTILNKQYCIKCPTEKQDELQQAATYLNQQMKKLQQTHQVNAESFAIVVALNTCNEYLQLKAQENQAPSSIISHIHGLEKRIENFLVKTGEVAV